MLLGYECSNAPSRGYRPTGAVVPFPTDPRFGRPRQPLALLVLRKAL